MLEEAIAVMRMLWQGGVHSHYGRYYTIEHARLYTLPDEPPPIVVAAAGPHAAAPKEGGSDAPTIAHQWRSDVRKVSVPASGSYAAVSLRLNSYALGVVSFQG
jgi:hypothetical protein